MLFTAGIPHQGTHPTWFGYLKDDGFTIHKKKGRIPVTWEEKKSKFLSVFPYSESPGVSVHHKVTAEDEWCAEAYLETDFTTLCRKDFENKLRTYLGYQYTSGALDNIIPDAVSPGDYDLCVGAWKPFRFDTVFQVKNGYYNRKPPTAQDWIDVIPFIGATENNNGVTSTHDLDDVRLYSRNGEENPSEPESRKIFAGRAITISNNGSVGNAFYQPSKFTCSHDVNPIYLIGRVMSPAVGMFLSTVIEVDKYRWGYGRKWRPTRMPSSIINLPVGKTGQPDWMFMETYIGSLTHSKNLS